MPKTLLLADDSVTIQKVVGISFANEDVVLVTVDNGDDALQKAREVQPDIVLADVVMPGLNGYEVCEAVKNDPKLQQTPVLLLTGTFEAFDEERAASAGANGHITKPFEAQALVDQVNALLARAAAPATAATPKDARADDDSLGLPGSVEASTASYEFFDEENTEPGTAAPVAVAPEPSSAVEPASEASFGFEASAQVVEELSVPTDPIVEPVVEMNPDETIVMPAGSTFDTSSPDGNPMASQSFGEAELAAAPVATPEPEPEPVAVPEPVAPAAPIFDAGAADASEAVIDPSGGRDYDVSSTDFGTPLVAPAPPPVPVATAVPVAAPTPPPIPEAIVSAREAAPAEPMPEPVSEPVFAPEPAASSDAAPAELSAEARQEIRDTIEKIAWEAFSRVSETITKDAIERIEKVAWEVVPQMAETLVNEEIRKMKGSS